MPLAIGARAPELTLKDYDNQVVSLADFRGTKKVLVVFFPFAFTGICGGELRGIQDGINDYQNNDVQVLGISCDSVFALKVWAEREKYSFPLLSDRWPTGAAASAFGVFNERLGVANRGTFLIDRSGTIVFAEENQPGEPRDQAGWRKAIEAA